MNEVAVAYFKVLYRYFCGGTEEKLSQDTWSPGRDLNLGPPEYGAGVLETPTFGFIYQESKEDRLRIRIAVPLRDLSKDTLQYFCWNWCVIE
jgi:hypothetical protein